MRKLTAALAVVALISSVTIAEARGGRTTAADCEAGSDDPDCPDAPDQQSKPPPPKPPPRKEPERAGADGPRSAPDQTFGFRIRHI
jgi:hypothetical protein